MVGRRESGKVKRWGIEAVLRKLLVQTALHLAAGAQQPKSHDILLAANPDTHIEFTH